MSQRVAASTLIDFIVTLLSNEGADQEQAGIFASALVWSDLIGRSTHGVWRLPAYITRFKKGLIKCPCKPVTHTVSASVATINGDSGFGHYLGHFGMQQAITLAKESGAGIATVSHSNHFGTGAYFVNLAAREGMLGIATSNSIAKLAPAGGRAPVFGTNPIAFGVPRSHARPIIIDMSTAATSGASVIQAAEKGETLPEGILIDREGRPIVDPAKASEGVMLPFGGAKGSGLAFMVELLSGVITGAALSSQVRSMFSDFSGNGDNGHCFIAVDLKKILPMDIYSSQLEALIDQMRASSPQDGPQVRLPGELRWQTLERQTQEGITLETHIIEELIRLADQFNMPPPI